MQFFDDMFVMCLRGTDAHGNLGGFDKAQSLDFHGIEIAEPFHGFGSVNSSLFGSSKDGAGGILEVSLRVGVVFCTPRVTNGLPGRL